MKNAEKLETIGRQTLMAGIGALDTGREVATDKLDKLYIEGNTFVNSLIAKGESLEAELKSKLGSKSMLNKKIAALKAKLGIGVGSREQQIDRLSAKVDTLIEVVAKLAQQKAAEKVAEKKAAEQRSATATKPDAKTAARKPAATEAKTPVKPRTRATASKAKPPAKPASNKS